MAGGREVPRLVGLGATITRCEAFLDAAGFGLNWCPQIARHAPRWRHCARGVCNGKAMPWQRETACMTMSKRPASKATDAGETLIARAEGANIGGTLRRKLHERG
jgi:hypothetical protein